MSQYRMINGVDHTKQMIYKDWVYSSLILTEYRFKWVEIMWGM